MDQGLGAHALSAEEKNEQKFIQVMFYCSQNMSQVFNALTSNVKWGPSEISTFFPYLVSLWTWWLGNGEWEG